LEIASRKERRPQKQPYHKRKERTMTVEERIERLERNNRRLLAGLVAVILLGIGVAAIPNPGGDVVDEVRARKFTLVDVNGKERAMLDMTEDGPVLRLYDEIAKVCAELNAAKTGPTLRLYDENGKSRAGLTVTKDGIPGLAMIDENDKSRVVLCVTKDGMPELAMFDENGKSIWKAPCSRWPWSITRRVGKMKTTIANNNGGARLSQAPLSRPGTPTGLGFQIGTHLG